MEADLALLLDALSVTKWGGLLLFGQCENYVVMALVWLVGVLCDCQCTCQLACRPPASSQMP